MVGANRTVIRRATAVCVDSADTVIRNATIVIDDGVITSVSEAVPGFDVPAPGGAGEAIDADGAIVMPGMVNAHAHLAMSLLRGVADGQDLDGFLATVLPLEGSVLSDEFVAVGTELAAAECLRSGITSSLDMYFFLEAAHRAASSVGMRLHSGPVFVQFAGPDQREWAQRMAWARDWLQAGDGAPSSHWLCPHSTYLLDEEQLREVAALSLQTGARVHVHAAETAAEMALVSSLHGGRTPVEVLHHVGLLTDRTVLAHCVHVTDRDIGLIAAAGTHVVHNPASNAKLASGLAPLVKMLDAGINVALGTDGSASANDLDLWMAMRLAGFIPSVMHDSPSALSAPELLRMATINGARALGREAELGSIEVGKRADLIVLDADSPTMFPSYDDYSTLAYVGSRGDVRLVLVDGRFVVRDRLLIDVADGLRERVALMAALVQRHRVAPLPSRRRS